MFVGLMFLVRASAHFSFRLGVPRKSPCSNILGSLIFQLRNGVTQRAPGDKPYAHVDYSPDFFSQEGVSESG